MIWSSLVMQEWMRVPRYLGIMIITPSVGVALRKTPHITASTEATDREQDTPFYLQYSNYLGIRMVSQNLACCSSARGSCGVLIQH